VTGQADFSRIVGYGTDMGNAEDAAMSTDLVTMLAAENTTPPATVAVAARPR
jgi:hypothetical protein